MQFAANAAEAEFAAAAASSVAEAEAKAEQRRKQRRKEKRKERRRKERTRQKTMEGLDVIHEEDSQDMDEGGVGGGGSVSGGEKDRRRHRSKDRSDGDKARRRRHRRSESRSRRSRERSGERGVGPGRDSNTFETNDNLGPGMSNMSGMIGSTSEPIIAPNMFSPEGMSQDDTPMHLAAMGASGATEAMVNFNMDSNDIFRMMIEADEASPEFLRIQQQMFGDYLNDDSNQNNTINNNNNYYNNDNDGGWQPARRSRRSSGSRNISNGPGQQQQSQQLQEDRLLIRRRQSRRSDTGPAPSTYQISNSNPMIQSQVLNEGQSGLRRLGGSNGIERFPMMWGDDSDNEKDNDNDF
jgi:hypothetical protein